MQIQVDFRSVFNTAVPRVYIKKVSLLPTSEKGERNGVSYDLESDDKLVPNKFGKKKPKQNNPRFRDVRPDGKALSVNVEVTIKEIIKENGDTTWYDNSQFKEYLNLKVVLVKNRAAIENLEDGKFTPRNLKRLLRKGMAMQKMISVRKDDTPIIDQKIEMIDGNSVYCTTYEINFKIPNYRPRNLSVFAASIIDLREYYLHKYPGVNPSRNFTQGAVVSQRVIQGGDTVTDSNIYLLPNNKLYAGPIHYHEPTGYMVGAFHSRQDHDTLERRKVPNLVVRDYRLLETIQESDLLLRPERKKRRKKLQNKRAQGNRNITKELYITEPDYAFNEKNELRFIFHLDMHKVIAEKTQFGACFTQADESSRRTIIRNTKIKNISVFRHKVRPGLTKNDIVLLDHEDKTELLAQSGERKRNFVRPRRTTRSLNPALEDSEKVLIGGIRELKLDLPSADGVRTFTVSDFDMAKKTDGVYSYSVDFEIADGTIPFANDQKKKLSQAIQGLTEFYNIANRPGNTNPVTGLFTDDFIKEMEATYKIPEFGEINIPNRRRRRRIVQSSIAKAPWLNAIAVYTDVMRNLTNVRVDDITRTGFLLHSLIEPSSGTVDGIETTLNMLNKLQNKLSLAVLGGRNRATSPLANTNVQMVDEIDFNARTSAFKGKLPKTSIRMTKKFNRFHDSNIQNSVGYDFLGLRQSKNLGLRVLTTKQLGQRLLLENQKYFSREVQFEIPEPDLEPDEGGAPEDFTRFIDLQDAYYSYLTPAKVMYGNKKINLNNRGRRLWNIKQYESIFTSLSTMGAGRDTLSYQNKKISRIPRTSIYSTLLPPIEYRSGYNKNKSKIDIEKYEANVANSVAMSKYGVTITTKKTERAFQNSENILFGLDDKEADNSKSVKAMGQGSNFPSGSIPIDIQALNKVSDVQLRDFSSVASIFVKSAAYATRGNLSQKKRNNILKFRPSNENNIMDAELEKYNQTPEPEKKKENFIRKMPNQIKSIFLGDDPRANKNWFTILENKGEDLLTSPRYAGLCYFNYNHINQIEVLVGFESDRAGTPQMSAPIYKVLNKTIFDRVSESGQPFVCRMRSAKVPFFGKSNKLSLPEFNETFILVSRTTNQDVRSDAEVIDVPEEAEEDFDFQSDDETAFVSRLTEYEDLNTTGRRMLRRLIRRDTRLGGLMPEYTSTTFVQQPRIIARVGTRFNASEVEPADNVDSGASATLIDIEQNQMQRTRAPRTATTTTRSTTSTASRAAPMSSGGGMTSGGGGY
jgi:hypothetical protein